MRVGDFGSGVSRSLGFLRPESYSTSLVLVEHKPFALPSVSSHMVKGEGQMCQNIVTFLRHHNTYLYQVTTISVQQFFSSFVHAHRETQKPGQTSLNIVPALLSWLVCRQLLLAEIIWTTPRNWTVTTLVNCTSMDYTVFSYLSQPMAQEGPLWNFGGCLITFSHARCSWFLDHIFRCHMLFYVV